MASMASQFMIQFSPEEQDKLSTLPGSKSKNPHCLFGSQPGGSGYTNLKATDGLTHRQIPAEFDPRSEDIQQPHDLRFIPRQQMFAP